MGAYAGVFTILAGKVVEEERGRVFTFEPQKRFCEILEANLKLNGLSNIVVREGKVTMKGMVVRGWGRGYIECTTLDAWARASHPERLDFIKMDVEGFERKVLRRGMEALRRFLPRMGICIYHLPDNPEVLRELILYHQPSLPHRPQCHRKKVHSMERLI